MRTAFHRSTDLQGMVFNIQKFSVHDGPGIRTTVFLKGCPLRCFWCCNPESHRMEPEVSYSKKTCVHCRACVNSCPAKALSAQEQGVLRSKEQCENCGTCVATCPTHSLRLMGQSMSVAQVVKVINEDSLFYTHSGGGFTFSGGEALLQPDFVTAVCKEAHKHGLASAMETSCYAPYPVVLRVCQFMDHVLVDIKHMDAARHKAGTGVSNERIINNIKKLHKDMPHLPLTLRMPVVPGFNDTVEDVRKAARFAGQLVGAKFELLAYHRLGEHKYENLGRDFSLCGVSGPAPERMKEFRAIASEWVELAHTDA